MMHRGRRAFAGAITQGLKSLTIERGLLGQVCRVLAKDTGLTEEAARRHLVRRSLHYDGPPLETYPCSPELYRQLEAETSPGPSFGVSYRLDTNGIAFPAKVGEANP